METSRARSRLGWVLCLAMGTGLLFSCWSGGEVGDSPPSSPSPNPQARAHAFRLFYRERSERAALGLNRFGMAGDAVFASVFNKNYIAKAGNQYEVVPGPVDNNPIGKTVYHAWKLYQAIGGRTLELTLIRLFEGLVFNEQVSGHPGLTCREALPGWTRVMDGIRGRITRTRLGSPVQPPLRYPETLEQEILHTFYRGLVFTYRENPLEYYFHFKPINEFTRFATTWVFADTLPRSLRISDCCSSWMITPGGYPWEGAFWGNHNSRDNFPDYAMGYLAALEAARTPGLPADLAQAARRAAEAGRRTGDAILRAGMILMTVGEKGDYQSLVPAGQVRPDGSREWQDLGSLSSCTMVYTARALSSKGLRHPVPELPRPGDLLSQGLQHLLDLVGLPLKAPTASCEGLDDAFWGLKWKGIVHLKLAGRPWYEMAEKMAYAFPVSLVKFLESTVDDFQEMMLGAVALCYYAKIVDDKELYGEARTTLKHLVQLSYQLSRLAHRVAMHPGVSAKAREELGSGVMDRLLSSYERLRYLASVYGRVFDLDTPLPFLEDFEPGNTRIQDVERHLDYPDTTPKPLKTDLELYDLLFTPGKGALANQKDPRVLQRYEGRFGHTAPVRRTVDGYECIGPEGQWQPAENDRHRWFGQIELWDEAPLCSTDTLHTLDCTWARLGCAPADLDESGSVGPEDLDLFNTAFSTYGEKAICSAENDGCGGADLDQNGLLDAQDRGYMNAAQGCKR